MMMMFVILTAAFIDKYIIYRANAAVVLGGVVIHLGYGCQSLDRMSRQVDMRDDSAETRIQVIVSSFSTGRDVHFLLLLLLRKTYPV